MDRIGFIGLGLMGNPMARRLMEGGFPLVVWNRTPDKARRALDAGASWADSPREVAERSDVVITMLTDSHACEEVACGPSGTIEGAHPGLVLLDMSSITPDTSRAIAEKAQEAGIPMLDAPVTGSVGVAGEGTLGIMVGGPREIFDRCLPILQRLGSKIVYVGANGTGTSLKIINNLVMNIATEAACEALVLAAKVGIDPALVIEITSVGGARTFAMQSRGPRILARDFTPRSTVNTMYKDLCNAVRLGEQAEVPLPVTVAVREIFQSARAHGLGELDNSAIVTVLESLANITVGGVKAEQA